MILRDFFSMTLYQRRGLNLDLRRQNRSALTISLLQIYDNWTTKQSPICLQPPMWYIITCFLWVNTTHCRTRAGSTWSMPFTSKPKSTTAETTWKCTSLSKGVKHILRIFPRKLILILFPKSQTKDASIICLFAANPTKNIYVSKQ